MILWPKSLRLALVVVLVGSAFVAVTAVSAQQTRVYEVDWVEAAQEANRNGYCFTIDGWGDTYAWATPGGGPSVTIQSITLTLSGSWIVNGPGAQITNAMQIMNYSGPHVYRMFGPRLSCPDGASPIAPNQVRCGVGSSRYDSGSLAGSNNFREETRVLRRGWTVESVDLVTPPGARVLRLPSRGARNMSVVIEREGSSGGTITGTVRLRGPRGQSWRRAFRSRPSCAP